MPPFHPIPISITTLLHTHLSQPLTCPSPTYDDDLTSALLKYLNNPSSLISKELQLLSRLTGHPTTGRKTELLDRLAASEAIPDNPPDQYPPDYGYSTERADFDGVGLDPATALIGRGNFRFEYDDAALTLFINTGIVEIAICSPGSPNPGIELDCNLLDGLAPVQNWQVVARKKKAKVKKRKPRIKIEDEDEGLLTVDAATGVRRTRWGTFRVVGLRCEGMVGMGFVFAREQGADGGDEVAFLGGWERGSGVAVALERAEVGGTEGFLF